MAFKKGQKVRLFVHGAGVVSEETKTIQRVTKTAVYDGDREYDPKTGRNLEEDTIFGFWFQIKPQT
jgi:hypothetical protein